MGTTTPTVVWSTPACSILAISRGSADSEDEVDRISRNSRARYRNRLKTFTPVAIFRMLPSTTKTNSAQVT